MSIKIKVYNQKAEEVGDMKLSDKIFGVKVNEGLVHQAVVTQMANERQVLAHTKDKSEVRGGGRKPWRQKGTGRARTGSIRNPIWRGGGITFGPLKDRNFKKKINKKMKQKALVMVLSDKVLSGNLVVMDELKIDEYKTKVFDGMLEILERVFSRKVDKIKEKKVGGNKKTHTETGRAQKQENTKTVKEKRSLLVINDKKDDKVKYSGRNLAGVEIINLNNINILDLLKYRDVIFTKKGIKSLEERYK
ncbi:MAG: 50S ribosomal protein L4 [Patescibacteria group bacterium]